MSNLFDVMSRYFPFVVILRLLLSRRISEILPLHFVQGQNDGKLHTALCGQPEPRVVSLNISSGGIPKRAVNSVRVTFAGLEGDQHNHQKHYRPEQAVSLQDIESLKKLNSLGYQLGCGTTGENINVSGLDINILPVGTFLHFEGGVQLRLTKARQPCYVLDSIHPQLKKDIGGQCGFYAEVVNEGRICVNEKIQVYLPNFVGVH